jgi:hypothetical protein
VNIIAVGREPSAVSKTLRSSRAGMVTATVPPPAIGRQVSSRRGFLKLSPWPPVGIAHS